MFCILKKNNYILPIFQNIIQSVENKLYFKIPEVEGGHYLAVKKLCALLKRITSKHDGGFYCFNCLHFFRTKNKLEKHKKVCENNFCKVKMPSENTNILQFTNTKNLIKHHLLFIHILIFNRKE